MGRVVYQTQNGMQADRLSGVAVCAELGGQFVVRGWAPEGSR